MSRSDKIIRLKLKVKKKGFYLSSLEAIIDHPGQESLKSKKSP